MTHQLRKILIGTIATCVVGTGAAGVAPGASAVTSVPSAVSAQAVSAVPSVRRAPKFVSTDARFGVTKSRSVKRLQRKLIRKGTATKGLRRAGTTGSYYRQTKKSVRKWQRKLGYTGAGADGIIGQASATALGLRWVVRGTSSTNSVSNSTPAPSTSGALSPNQLKSVLQRAGFREPSIRTAYGIAMRESRGYPGIASKPNSNGTQDHGLFQINDVHRSYIDFTNIYDALYNAQVAYNMSSGGTNFSAWGIGTQGWAGTLKKQSPSYWQMLQDEMERFKAQYPG
ncbi:MAG: hypothetical protein HQ526_02795 [Actinobacteria bacterium]|nr:hypothetical protein [Actinomycetota bacterium]